MTQLGLQRCPHMAKPPGFYCGSMTIEPQKCTRDNNGPLAIVFCPALVVKAQAMRNWPEQSWYPDYLTADRRES